MPFIRIRSTFVTAIFLLLMASIIAACVPGAAGDRPPHVQRANPSPIHHPITAFAPNVVFDITAGAGLATHRTPVFTVNGSEVEVKWDVFEDRDFALLSMAESIQPAPEVYAFQVQYWDNTGQEFNYAWNVTAAGGPGVPAAPTSTPPPFELHLRDTHWDNNGIALWWADPEYEVTRWVVERAPSDGRNIRDPFQPIAVLAPDALRPQWEADRPGEPAYDRWWDGGLPPHETYAYRIYACTPGGRIGYSNRAIAMVPEYMPGLEPSIATTPVPVTPPC